MPCNLCTSFESNSLVEGVDVQRGCRWRGVRLPLLTLALSNSTACRGTVRGEDQ